MFLLLHLLIFYNILIWKPCVSFYKEGTVDRIRGKLIMLCEELVIDAVSKIQSIQHFKESLYKSQQYQYGNIVYEMRFRHKIMYKLYASVLDDMESTAVGADGNEHTSYLDAIAEMDSLAHEILNFVAMIQLDDANRHADKSKAGYDLFFRRLNVAPIWLGLLDSMDKNDPLEPPPDLTRTGKRKNGVWHYAVPIE